MPTLHPLEAMLLTEHQGQVDITTVVRDLPGLLQRMPGLGLAVAATEAGYRQLTAHPSPRIRRLAPLVWQWSRVERALNRTRRRSLRPLVTLEDAQVLVWVDERRSWYEMVVHMALCDEELGSAGLFLIGTRFGVDVLSRAPIEGAARAAKRFVTLPARTPSIRSLA
jgi:hypothetical protein